MHNVHIGDENSSEAFSFSLIFRKESQEFQNPGLRISRKPSKPLALANICLVSTRVRMGTVMRSLMERDRFR